MPRHVGHFTMFQVGCTLYVLYNFMILHICGKIGLKASRAGPCNGTWDDVPSFRSSIFQHGRCVTVWKGAKCGVIRCDMTNWKVVDRG